jgi:hypothetical protein
MQVNVESWGPDCGPRPQSFTGEATGSVRVSEAGEQLVIHGTPERRTDACWSENRLVRRVSSTHEPGRWRVVCRTRPDDPRGETGTYTLTASDENRLNYREVSSYDWQLNESRCKATMTVTQVFSRVLGATPTPEAPTPEVRPSCTPGQAAQIRLRPSEAAVEPGGQVRFTARVVDAAGCPLRGQNIRFRLIEPAGARGTLDGGLFTAAANAAEAEGEFSVTATAGSFRAEAKVVVRTADLSDLIARRATVGATQTVDDDFEITTEAAAGVSARSEEELEEPSILPFVIGTVLVLALLIGVVVIIVARRGGGPHRETVARPVVPDEPGAAAAMGTGDLALDSSRRLAVPRSCPVCHREFDDPSITYCPEDGATLAGRSEPPLSGQALICPTCRRGYGSGTDKCPKDGDELIPYALFVSQHQKADAAGAKICPSCGERYGRQVTFCGKDGSELVVVN